MLHPNPAQIAPQLRHVRCPMCGNEFTTANPKQKYCSDACRQRAYRIRRKGGQRAHSNVQPGGIR